MAHLFFFFLLLAHIAQRRAVFIQVFASSCCYIEVC